eukprot:UN07452
MAFESLGDILFNTIKFRYRQSYNNPPFPEVEHPPYLGRLYSVFLLIFPSG